ncbi:MAG TPA: glycosyltransferase family 4 protein [Patescibacteria group bacterium]|nr:glycosyltransferase family 4 protein [Patescibacteria group bacterium]
MNILFVSAVLPYPLYSGGQIRIYNLLKRLSKRHTITLVSCIRSEEERAYKKDLAFCHEVHMVMRGRVWQLRFLMNAIGKYPLLLASYDLSDMRTSLQMLLDRGHFDLVHLEPFYVWPSVPNTDVPIVVSEHNVEYEVYKRITPAFFRWDTAKLAYWEAFVWKKAAALTAVSDDDALVMKRVSGRDVTIVHNGVDTKTFRFRKPNISKKPTLLFVGNFRWYPNREAAKTLVSRVWPKVRSSMPGARLWIVGKDIPEAYKEFEKKTDDIATIYRDADILVAPHSVPSGTKYKMLEAMATGLPIVTTKEGAKGLGMEENVHYVTDITRLWDNPSLAEDLAKNGRKLVEEKYAWDQISQKLDYVWKNA